MTMAEKPTFYYAAIRDHIAEYVGEIADGVEIDGAHADLAGFPTLQILRVANMPAAGCSTYVTNGLHGISLETSKGQQRHTELMLCVYDDIPGVGAEVVQGVLFSLCTFLATEQRAFMRGRVLGPFDGVFPDDAEAPPCTGFYAAQPVPFGPDFATFTPEKGAPEIFFTWALPISTAEYDFVLSDGWQNFEALIEEHDPDLGDPYRSSLV
jgi:hypothetical protein